MRLSGFGSPPGIAPSLSPWGLRPEGGRKVVDSVADTVYMCIGWLLIAVTIVVTVLDYVVPAIGAKRFDSAVK